MCAAAAVAGALLGGCGGSSTGSAGARSAGSGICHSSGVSCVSTGQVPKGDLTLNGVREDEKGSVTTVPLTKANPISALFTALSQFDDCLTGRGMTFIGIPSRSNPHSPTNSPEYITALKTCAASSNIITALKTAQTAQNNLTPAQVKTRNKQYLKWRQCMIAHGWQIPAPKPNAKGLLFTFSPSSSGGGGGGSSVGGFKPPPGQSLFNSPDLSACAAQAQREVPTT